MSKKERPRPTKEIGAQLREMRLQANMTQADVARRLNVSSVFVSSTELGYRPNIPERELDLFARAMGYDGFPEGVENNLPNRKRRLRVGDKIQAFLKKQSLTPQQLAESIEVRLYVVQGWLSGEPIARAHQKKLEATYGPQDWRQPAPTKVTKKAGKGPLGLLMVRLREEKGWSLRELARQPGYGKSSQYISLIELGYHLPNDQALEELARVFGCALEILKAARDQQALLMRTQTTVDLTEQICAYLRQTGMTKKEFVRIAGVSLTLLGRIQAGYRPKPCTLEKIQRALLVLTATPQV